MADEELISARPDSNVTETEGRTFCASCFSPLDGDVDRCGNCDVALSQPATVEPPKSTLPRSGRAPSALTVIGMWLVLLPGLVIAFGMLMQPVEARVRIRIIVGLVFWAYGAVLYKVTSRYLEAKRSTASRTATA